MRGYYTLYPGEETARNLATVHNELYHAPEEYAAEAEAELGSGEVPQLLADDATEEEVEAARQRARAELEAESHASGPGSASSLLDALPSGAELRPVIKLPLLSWDGARAEAWQLEESAARLAAQFRHEVGGCAASDPAAASGADTDTDADVNADADADADTHAATAKSGGQKEAVEKTDVLAQELFCDPV